MSAIVYPLDGKRIWVAGHNGMVGSAVARRLASENCKVVTIGRKEVDLTRQSDVETWLRRAGVNAIVLAAAKVGGIHANDVYPADFLYQNLAIEANVIEAAHRAGVNRLLFLGSSCIYPRLAPQPIEESALLTGPLEPTNEWYAIAKIAGIKLCQAYRKQFGCDYIASMPTNLYGPGDNFDLATSHVIPALIRKAHEAKTQAQPHMTIWGTGTPRREFLYVDDCADALVHLLKVYSGMEHINVGSGADLTVFELTKVVCHVVGYQGEIATDPSKPDGTPRKLMSGEKLAGLGWRPSTSLEAGIHKTYQWFLAQGGDLGRAVRDG